MALGSLNRSENKNSVSVRRANQPAKSQEASSDLGGSGPQQLSGTAAAAVSMRGIEKRFGANVALKSVDFTVERGEIHALLGENGAGKSTLMHILAGLVTPDSGTIQISGATATISSPRRARSLGIAMVHQHFTLAPALTVAENIALDSDYVSSTIMGRLKERLSFVPRIAAKNAFSTAEQLGWRLNPGAPISTLSVGEQQRVEIVKALAADASVVIFDEPTAVLIGDEVEDLFEVLRTLKRQGKAIVLIAHKLSEILAVADRVTVLRKGTVVTAGREIGTTTAQQLATWMVGDLARESSDELVPEKIATLPLPFDNVSVDLNPATLFSATDITVAADRGETPIRGLNLEVSGGEIVGIGGVDGNGQVELAEALCGLRTLVSGSLQCHAGVAAYIPQDRRREGLAVSMSVSDNLLFGASQRPEYRTGLLLNMRKLRALSSDLIRSFDIRTSSADAPVSSLSGGNQQKIVVARALQNSPDFIVAMNPTRGLDIGATRFVHQQLIAARNRGAAVVVISTDLDEIAALADRSLILSGGKLEPYQADNTNTAEIGLLLGGAAASINPSHGSVHP